MEIYVVVDWIETDHYRVTIEDVATDVGLEETVSGITVYHIGNMIGLEVRNSEGLFASDITGSGAYRLRKVEAADGTILHI